MLPKMSRKKRPSRKRRFSIHSRCRRRRLCLKRRKTFLLNQRSHSLILLIHQFIINHSNSSSLKSGSDATRRAILFFNRMR